MGTLQQFILALGLAGFMPAMGAASEHALACDDEAVAFSAAREYRDANGEATCKDKDGNEANLIRFPKGALACRTTLRLGDMAEPVQQPGQICVKDGEWVYRVDDSAPTKPVVVREQITARPVLIDTHSACPEEEQTPCEALLAESPSGKGESLSKEGMTIDIRLVPVRHRYLQGSIEDVLLNTVPTSEIAAEFRGDSLRLTSKVTGQRTGQLQIVLVNGFGERARVPVTLAGPSADTKPTVLGIKLELALARKLRADEDFLRLGVPAEAERSPIAAKYKQALDGLPQCFGKDADRGCDKLDPATLATLRLAKVDIEYRLLLLERGVGFAGGFRTLRPTTPHQELIKMRDHLESMKGHTDAIERWQNRQVDLQLQDLQAEAQAIFATGQNQSDARRAAVKDIEAIHSDTGIQKNLDRIGFLKSHMVDMAKRQERASDVQEQLASRAGKLVQAGLAAATGLPVAEVEALAEGDLRKAALSYVERELKDQGSAFAKEFNETNAVASQLNEQVSEFRAKADEIKRAADDANRYRRDIEALASGLNGSIEEVTQRLAATRGHLGTMILDDLNLHTKARQQLAAVVEATKPIGSFISAARAQLDEVRDQRDQVLEHHRMLVRMSKQLEPDRATLDKLVRSVSSDVLQALPVERIGEAQSQVLAIMAEARNPAKMHALLVDFYPDIASAPILRSALAAARDEDIALIRQQLVSLQTRQRGDAPGRSSGLHAYFDTSRGAIRVRARTHNSWTDVSYQTLVRELTTAAPRIRRDAVQALATGVDDSMTDTERFLLLQTLVAPERIGAEIDAALRKSGKAMDIERTWRQLTDEPLLSAKEVQTTVNANIASHMAFQQEEPRQKGRQVTATRDDQVRSSGELHPQAAMALNMALNAAFPGAGVALQLGQTWASMDANRGLIEQLDKEILGTGAELIALEASVQLETRDAVIAKKEAERNRALADAAAAQLQQYRFVMELADTEIKEFDQRLRLYRPLFFYTAEMLRERFDAFDRSLAMWSTGTPESGFLADKITGDPRMTRLALDSEIHLFGWLNREREATRTDPFHLTNHWEQLFALANAYCADHGCKPGDGRLGKVAATAPVRLFRDLASTSDWNTFRRWKQASGRTNTVSLPITLSPLHKLVPLGFTNVRLLDINLVAIDRTGQRLRGNFANVRHSGFAQIPYATSTGELLWRDERLLPSARMPPSNDEAFNLTDLAERFQTQVSSPSLMALRGFEGYGFYGVFDVSIADLPGIAHAEDFEVQFAYIYHEPGDIRREQDFVSLYSKPDAGCANEQTREESLQNGEAPPDRYCVGALGLAVREPSGAACSNEVHRIVIHDDGLLNAWAALSSQVRVRDGASRATPGTCWEALPSVLTIDVPAWIRGAP